MTQLTHLGRVHVDVGERCCAGSRRRGPAALLDVIFVSLPDGRGT